MPVPDFQSLMLPLLKAFADGGGLSRNHPKLQKRESKYGVESVV